MKIVKEYRGIYRACEKTCINTYIYYTLYSRVNDYQLTYKII